MNERYKTYLQSQEWAQKARKRIEIDNHRCVVCGSCGTVGNELEVHHLSYRNIYNEDVYCDLATLCRTCHKNTHRLLNRVTNAEGRRGWQDRTDIPTITTYMIGGDYEYKEV